MDKNSIAHTKWNCKYHIILTPKYRRKIIYQQMSKDIGTIIRTLCARKGIYNNAAGIVRLYETRSFGWLNGLYNRKPVKKELAKPAPFW